MVHQGVFKQLESQGPCALDEFGQLKNAMNYLHALGVIGQNSEEEYYLNQYTQLYLECLASYPKCQPELIEKLLNDEQRLSLSSNEFNQITDETDNNTSHFCHQLKLFEQTGSLLYLMPEINDYLSKWQSKIASDASSQNVDCIVYITHSKELVLLNGVIESIAKNLDDKTRHILVLTDENHAYESSKYIDCTVNARTLQKEDIGQLKQESKKIMWVNCNPQLEINENGHLLDVIKKALAPIYVHSIEMIGSHNKLVNACITALHPDHRVTLEEPVNKFLMYSQRKLMPENDALDVIDRGDIKFVVARLKPVKYKITGLNADNLNKSLMGRDYLLTVKEANRLFKSFPKWQFSIDSCSNSTKYLFGQWIADSSALTNSNPHDYLNLSKKKGKCLHLIWNGMLNVESPQYNLIRFALLMAKLSNDISEICFIQPQSKVLHQLISSILPAMKLNCDKLKNQAGQENLFIHSLPFVKVNRFDPVAVIGYSLNSPGANSSQAFWEMITNGGQAIAKYKLSDRIKVNDIHLDNTEYQGGLVSQPIDQFDAEFFNISAAEATYMDPQQRLLLEGAWHALEHAGITLDKLKDVRTGIYIGVSNQDFGKLVAKYGDVKSYHRSVNAGSNNGTIAGRLAYFLKAKGPCIVFDTACASSSTALYYAKKSLDNKEIDVAIVGGVNLILSSEFTAGDNAMGVISKTGAVRSFSDDADGYVRSEGIAVTVLSNLSFAKNNRYSVHGIIPAIQISQEVNSKNFTIPGVKSQENVMSQALSEAHLNSDEIDLLEAHATGTRGGDAIELNAIERVYSKRDATKPLWLTSSKPNIGHTEASSGLISLIKVLLALQHEKIPAQVSYSRYNERCETHSDSIQVAQYTQNWVRSDHHTRRGAVTSLSFSGANVHILIEESPTDYSYHAENVTNGDKCNHLLLLSAISQQRLKNQLIEYVQYLKDLPEKNQKIWSNIAYSTAVSRQHFEYREAIIASSIEDAILELNKVINGEQSDKLTALEAVDLQYLKTSYLNHSPINWDMVWSGKMSERIQLPLYSFQPQSYWPHFLGGKSDPTLDKQSLSYRNEKDILLLKIYSRIIGREIYDIEANFFDIGGHSIKLADLKQSILVDLGVDVPFKQLFDLNTVKKLSDSLPAVSLKNIMPFQLTVDVDNKFQPFPLMPIQQAYWIGRELPVSEFGGVSTHLYYELNWNHLDLPHFEATFNQMIERHDMLRAIILKSGEQQILKEIDHYKIKIHDFSSCDSEQLNQAILNVRSDLSHEKFPADVWPLFKIEVMRCPERDIVIFSFDCLIIDMFSLHILMREWYQVYSLPNMILPKIEVSFRDYVLADDEMEMIAYKAAEQYWLSRIPDLPSAPELPLLTLPAQLKKLTFGRVERRISRDTWDAIKNQSKTNQISPTSVLLALFAAVLSKWSTNKKFLINLTLFTRKQIHSHINQVLGDFTLTQLLSVNCSGIHGKTIIDIVKEVHAQLWEDMEHKAFDGLSVIREISKTRHSSDRNIAPIVFTSLLNLDTTESENTWLSTSKNHYGITQTPQVWLDHKTFEDKGDLIAEWDYVKELFDNQMISDIHNSYCDLVDEIAKLDWNAKVPLTLPRWHSSLINYKPVAEFFDAKKGLHQLFDKARQLSSEKIAVISSDRVLTYQQIYATAQMTANKLHSYAKPNELIAVLCAPGWRQVVACLGIQYSGAAYLPLDVSWPAKLLAELLLTTKAKAVISSSEYSDLLNEVTSNIAIEKILLDEVQNEVTQHIDANYHPDHLAYVIFTSGSTGKPKGVKITHRAAVNTVLDINQRYNVTQNDTVFSISKLSFDLSVYDIFGLLAVGGRIVFPDISNDKDPSEWYKLCSNHQVTLWNSVPKIVEMMVAYLGNQNKHSALLSDIRLVMMSGDSIPADLPLKIQNACPHPSLRKISLGGATEGSIWSIEYEINEIKPGLHSIPYGKALSNQTMMILDEDLQDTPIGVMGDIYIGGIGVAQGYWEEPLKTAAAFKIHPDDKSRIYCTGDRGYKNEFGDIIFCGRLDNQVKINGYRIELGGIRNCLIQLPVVQDCTVLPVETEGGKKLVAFVKKKPQARFDVMLKNIHGEITDESKKSEFKLTAYKNFQQQRFAGAIKNSLLKQSFDEILWARKSYRQFEDSPIRSAEIQQLLTRSFSSLLPEATNARHSMDSFLSVLAAMQGQDQLLPKYLYPSAGSTYPVKLYLQVGENDLNLHPGLYYYHAGEHALYSLHNKEVHKPGIKLFLVAHEELIKPLYGERSNEFIAYEQGSIKTLLSLAAKNSSWGLNATQNISANSRSILKLNENDKILEEIDILPSANDTFQKVNDDLNVYLYMQRNDGDIEAGLYQIVKGKCQHLGVLSDYPLSLDHPGDNANIVSASPAILLVTASSQAESGYQYLGSLSQQWMLNGIEQGLGLCPLGLPIIQESLCQAMQGELLMAFALGHVSHEQQMQLSTSVTNYSAPTLSQYLQTSLENQQILPSYMIPRDYVCVDKIPLTSNGKVDRKTLLEKYEQLPKEMCLPVTLQVNEIVDLVDLFEQVLKRKIDPAKSFIANGIYSYNAHILKTALENKGYSLLISDMLKDYTINEFVSHILSRQQVDSVIRKTPIYNHSVLQTINDREPIAIIGMSCRFPGANNLDAFWRLLNEGVDGLTYYEQSSSSDRLQLKSFGAIEGMLEFDNEFFNISPKKAALMHPAQRVWLESVCHALEDAGYGGEKDREKIGVYASAGGEPYLHTSYYQKDGLLTRTRNEIDYFAASSAYQFNLTGPVLTIQSACSSSLASIHLAVRALRSNEASMMIAGGIHTSRFNQSSADYPENSIFSAQGQCQPFSELADGIVETQGVGVVVLKRLSKARKDGDHVYATILGSALANDGSHKRDFTSPNRDSQQQVMKDCLIDANVSSRSISVIEAHGTGTPIGDPIEFESLNAIYGADAALQSLALGSVKSNIGHTVTAAGVAGVIKMGLALQNKIIPASLHATVPNKLMNMDKSPFYINHQTKPWKNNEGALRAAISSFGMGGTNAHAILEEVSETLPTFHERLLSQWQSVEDCAVPSLPSNDSGKHLLLFSAKTPTALQHLIKQYITFLKTNVIELADLAYTLATGRDHMSYRLVIEAASVTEVLSQLSDVTDKLHEKPQPLQSCHYQISSLTSEQLEAFSDWYQKDACYRSLVDSCKNEGNHALDIVYLYSALRRYYDCGLKYSVSGESELLVSLSHLLSKKHIEIANKSMHAGVVISVSEAQAGFQQVIGEHYLRGEKINWHAYWRGSVREKVRLPLYPFERRLFWQESVMKEVVAERQENGLLGEGPISLADDAVIYQQELNLDLSHQQYLSGHKVLSSCVFPGAGYTELLLSAGRRLDEKAMVEISMLSYREPLKLVRGETRICQVELKLNEGNAGGKSYQAKIISWVKGENRGTAVVHAEGGMLVKTVSARRVPHVDIGRLSNSFAFGKDVETIYKILSEDGVHYEGGFRGISTFASNEQQKKGIARLQLKDGLSSSGYMIHPVLLDGAFQALAGLLLLNKQIPEGMVYIPAGHGVVKYYQEASAIAYAQVTASAVGDEHTIGGDIALYTGEGDLVLTVMSLALVRVPKSQLQKRLGESELEEVTYHLGWNEKPAEKLVSNARTWLLAGGDKKLVQKLQTSFLDKNERVIILGQEEMVNHVHLDHRLKGVNGEIGVIYLGGLLKAQLAGVWNLVELAQGLHRSEAKVTRFLVLTEQAVAVHKHDQMNGVDQGVYRGLCTSLSAAKPYWQAGLLDVDDIERKDIADLIVQEGLQAGETEMMLSYRGGVRFAARLSRQQTGKIHKSLAEKLFGENEACLVSGGLGGLGLCLAEWLVSKGAKHLVLMSRKTSEPVILDSWRKEGVRIEVAKADVSDFNVLSGIFAQIRKDKKQLAGIFHLAGVLRDKLLENLTEEDFSAVFSAKVTGASNLHQLSLDEASLRYFVLFSSLVSLIGSPGQLNYAAANGYLDSLSEYRERKGLPSQRVNFGAWAEKGMAAELSEAQRHRGLGQISISDGLNAVGESLAEKQSSLVIARVEWEKLWRGRQQLGLTENLVSIVKPQKKTGIALLLEQANKVDRKEMLKQFLREKVASELGKSPEEIETNIGFQEMIRDSIQLSQLTGDLKVDLQEYINIDNELLWIYPDIERLSEHLNQQIKFKSTISAEDDLKEKEQWQKKLPNFLKIVCTGKLHLLKSASAIETLCDEQGRSSLYVAVCNKQIEMAKWLIDKGADPQKKTTFGVSVIEMVDVINHSELNEIFNKSHIQKFEMK